MQDNRESSLQPQSSSKDEIINKYSLLKQENERLLSENTSLKKNLEKEEIYHRNLYKQWNELNTSVSEKNLELQQLKSVRNPKLKVYQYSFYGLLAAIILLVILNYYSFKNKTDKRSASENNNTSQTISYATKDQGSTSDAANIVVSKKEEGNFAKPKAVPQNLPQENNDQLVTNLNARDKATQAKYLVKVKSYFYNEPDINTQRSTFVLPWNNSYGILTALDDKNGFIYVVFKNHAGRTSKGWIRKSDLELIK